MSDRIPDLPDPPEPIWTYRQQSMVDQALGKLECAASGHRWWWVVSDYFCSRCGARR